MTPAGLHSGYRFEQGDVAVTLRGANACGASHVRCIWPLASLHCGPIEKWVVRGYQIAYSYHRWRTQ
jgi:hypothetical protein